ncbi:MAG: hypothetical protein GXP62_09885, partial [Oligoflexia bacterium]|nr:hypothetical protein [Oligoflexia bacterium]
MITLLALACGGAVQTPTASAQPTLVATVKRKQVAQSEPVELTVEARQTVGWTIDVSPPLVQGLDVSLVETRDPVD